MCQFKKVDCSFDFFIIDFSIVSGYVPKVFYRFFLPSVPLQYLRVFAKVFTTLVLGVVSRNDEAAATAINT